MSVWPTLGTFYFEQGALELGCMLTKAEGHQENPNVNPQQPPMPPVSKDPAKEKETQFDMPPMLEKQKILEKLSTSTTIFTITQSLWANCNW